METYKKIIIVRMFLLSMMALLAVGLGIYDVFWATAEIKASEIFEFQCGITTALGILALIRIIRYRKALRNFLYIDCSRGDTVGDCLYHKVYIYKDNIRRVCYESKRVTNNCY